MTSYGEELALLQTAVLRVADAHDMRYQGYEESSRTDSEMDEFALDVADAVLAVVDELRAAAPTAHGTVLEGFSLAGLLGGR